MKRLCIFITYDSQNIIDEYIGYLLKEIKTCVSHLVVVCNELELVKGQDILEHYADQIFYRKNIGFDAGGFKDALCEYLGWDGVMLYDELVLVNDSFFGPFRPMRSIFDEMVQRKVDFWGLLKHGKTVYRNGRIITEHIQSFFLVVRKRMLNDRSFKDYWENMPYYSNFMDVINNHELKFTEHFADKGFSYDVLADVDINISDDYKNNYNQYGFIAYELIHKRNFPFLKKKPLAYEMISFQTQENFRKCMNYINDKTEYDVRLIWSNIIRTMNIADIYRNFHLRYIIADESKKVEQCRVLIVLFASSVESLEYVWDYIKHILGEYDIRIYADNADVYRCYQQHGLECIEYSQIQISEMFECFSGYDLVGVVHDADISSITEPNYIGKARLYNIWENLIKNKSHINGIIKKFQEEPWLGLLISPLPNFGKYFGELGKGWDGKFAEVQDIVNRLNLNCKISYINPPIEIARNFWIRGEIFKIIKDITREDIDILPYIWTYIVQHVGFVSGIVESTDYASMNEVNFNIYLNEILLRVRDQFHIKFEEKWELNKEIFRKALAIYSQKYKNIYVYGTGYVAQEYKDYFSHIEGYIVSDGYPRQNEINGIKVYYLSEVCMTEDLGIVVCMDKKNQSEVIPLLINKGIFNYLCI